MLHTKLEAKKKDEQMLQDKLTVILKDCLDPLEQVHKDFREQQLQSSEASRLRFSVLWRQIAFADQQLAARGSSSIT